MKVSNLSDNTVKVADVWIPAGESRNVRAFDENEPRTARFLAEGTIATPSQGAEQESAELEEQPKSIGSRLFYGDA